MAIRTINDKMGALVALINNRNKLDLHVQQLHQQSAANIIDIAATPSTTDPIANLVSRPVEQEASGEDIAEETLGEVTEEPSATSPKH